MLSQARILKTDDTFETEDGSLYIDTNDELLTIESRKSEPLKTYYLPIDHSRIISSEVREKQVEWWFGRVDQVFKDYFTAILEDLRGNISIVEFDLEELSPSDLDLLAPGVKFSYSIAQVDKLSGREYVSKISPSGPPIWREKDIEQAKELGDKSFPEDLLDF